MRITHDDPALLLESVTPEGKATSSTRLTTDGSENLNEKGSGTLLQRSRSRWEEGVLITEWRVLRDGATFIEGTDTWRLSPDGRSLTQITTTEDSKSTSRTSTVYVRK